MVTSETCRKDICGTCLVLFKHNWWTIRLRIVRYWENYILPPKSEPYWLLNYVIQCSKMFYITNSVWNLILCCIPVFIIDLHVQYYGYKAHECLYYFCITSTNNIFVILNHHGSNVRIVFLSNVCLFFSSGNMIVVSCFYNLCGLVLMFLGCFVHNSLHALHCLHLQLVCYHLVCYHLVWLPDWQAFQAVTGL